METKNTVRDLETAWSDEYGFLFQLRRGKFDPAKAEELLSVLRKIDLSESEPIDRRVVSLVWYLPLFIGWQRERVDLRDVAAVAKVQTLVTNEVERLLGVP